MANSGHPYGIHFAIGLQPAPTLTDHDRNLLAALRPAGIILFKPNFDHDSPYAEWLATLRELLADARAAIGRDRILVAIDHEGGRVIRTPPPVTHFAYAREWSTHAGAVARAMAIELRSLGINVTFAPVVDIHSNPDNPVIGPRAFATTADEVAHAALDFVRAVEDEELHACPKHFPGHGDTAVDSHHGLPVVEYTLDQLRGRELLPFQAMIRAGVRMIMTSHILFPKIEAGVPATMSARIIRDVLRGELGFDGVVVTDDIGMGAVRDMFERPETVEQMMNATTDLIDICAYGTDTTRALQIADAIGAAVDAGRIERKVIGASRARIEALLATLPQHPVEQLDESVFARHAAIAPLHDPNVQGAATWQARK